MNIKEHPKWKRITLPDNLFPESVSKGNIRVNIKGEGIETRPYSEAFSEGIIPQDFMLEQTSVKDLGEAFKGYVNSNYNKGFYVRSESANTITSTVRLDVPIQGTQVENHILVAEEGASLNVILNYISESNLPSMHYGITRLIAKRGSRIKLIKVQQLKPSDQFFDQNFSIVEDGGSVEVVDVQLGSGFSALSHDSVLAGRNSRSSIKSLYYGDHGSLMDLSYTMRHRGAHSESVILSKGALDGDAKKVFRGNLIFETGSQKSVGREKEVVVLLSENVKTDSIPALLCSEDDVIGEHAASIGQVDQEKLFYLMSRGLSATEAKKLVVKAAFDEILLEIDDVNLRTQLMDALDGRLTQ
ncbi:MAG: SufD family Fe-S cluster assembly protein [Clostridiales bacterium]|nr:SufD family Fe-S cluster assembly protein [Clostridiales bacterium]